MRVERFFGRKDPKAMNIVLIGYRACGKSAVGRLLSNSLGWPLVDTDALIEQRSGMTIRDIFADHAESQFRALESRIVQEVACLNEHIISTGGGAVLQRENAHALQRSGWLIWLTASPETIWRRILTDQPRLASRPDFDRLRGLENIRNTFQQRAAYYRRWADTIVDSDQRSPQAVAAIILERVHETIGSQCGGDIPPSFRSTPAGEPPP